MDGIIAYILSKKYTNDTVIGMGAIKGAACQVQSINKVNKTTTITLEWEDNVGTSHTQSFDIEDGLDGVSVTGATIKPDGHLELTLSNGNSIDCGKVLPQYDTMPTPSSSNEGQILQYIGTTTSNYTNGYFYECINDGGTYKWVEKLVQDSYTKIQIGDLSNLPDNTKNVVENIVDINNKIDNKENIFRYNVIPTANVSISGAIIQYIGTTNATYTNGYYYQCVESPVGSGTYVWVQKNVQPNNGGGGGDGVVDGYYNSADQLFYEDSAFLNPITGEDNTIYVDLNTNGLYRYDGTIFIKVSSSTDSYTKAEIGDLSDLPDTSKNVIENIDLLNEDIDLLNGSILTIKTDITQLQGSLANKVDKEAGKGLSTNDYTDENKEKLVKLSPIYLIGSGLNLDSVTGELTASGIDVPIDTELSDTSINPVQNKVITTKIEQLEASKLSLSDVDNALSGSSINPVQNQVITLAIDQLQGSVLNKIQKMLGAQEDNFTVIDNNGGVKDSGISKDVVPITASASNKLLVASDLSTYQEKLTEGDGIDIDTNNKISVDISYLTASRVGYIPSSEKGAHSGVAELDSTGKVPSSQLPSYIDDVIDGYYNDTDGKFYEDSAYTTEITGETGKIYISIDTNIQYRWDNISTPNKFVPISATIDVDNDFSTTSTNPIQNKVITAKINDIDILMASKVDKETGKGLSTNDYTDEDKQKVVDLAPIYLIGSGLTLDTTIGSPTYGKLQATGMSIPIDDELSETSINPVQNKVIALKIDQLQGSVLDKIRKRLSAQEDNFAIWNNDGEIEDSGISKDIIPTNASASNKVLVKSDVDNALSTSSENPVQNKEITVPLQALQGSMSNVKLDITDLQGSVLDIKSDITDLQNDKQDKLTEGNGIDIDSSNNISLDISYLTASRIGYIPNAEKGTANGVAELDSTGKVPSSQLPSNELNDLNDVVITSPVNKQILAYNSTSGKWENQTGQETIGGIVYKGSILFANLPTTGMVNGDSYDIKDAFVTDNRFEEGSGIACGAGTDVAWVESDNKWNILTPSGVYSFNGRTGAVLPATSDYNADQVDYDNTTSGLTATDVQDAIDENASDISSHIGNTSNPHNVTATQIGLGNVVNTGDSATPVSGGTTKFTTGGAYTELNKKADKVTSATNGHLAGLNANGNLTDSGVVASNVIQKVATATGLLKDNGTVDTTSYATASNLSNHISNTSNPHSVTKSQIGLGNVVNTGDSATPVSGGTTKFTTGGAYVELNKKYDINDTAETSLADGDYIPFYDTSAKNKRKTTWKNIKSVLKSYFDALYTGALQWIDL